MIFHGNKVFANAPQCYVILHCLSGSTHHHLRPKYLTQHRILETPQSVFFPEILKVSHSYKIKGKFTDFEFVDK